jgi:hypothetical protein
MQTALADLVQALEKCQSSPTWTLTGEPLRASLGACFQARAQLDAVCLALIHEADAQGVAVAQGATNTATWLRDSQRLSIQLAHQLVKLAAWLHREGEPTGAALATGSVNVEQARVIAAAVEDLPAEFRAEGEAYLVEQSATFGPKELGALGQRLFEVIAPDQAEQREQERLQRAEQRAHKGRAFHLTDAGAGRVRLSGWLSTADAAVVNAAIDPLCTPRGGGADLRTPTQRRADALVDVCRLALACDELPDNGGERPQVVVTTDLDVLRSQVGAARLDDGSLLSATEARLAACDATILPAVLGGAGQVLDLGRERRLFTGAVRRAVVLRDRGCAFPSCDRPPRWCDVHHCQHWVDGGPTCLDNAVMLCRHHHRVIHRGEWRVRINPRDGLPDFFPPSYVDNTGRPHRNQYHRRD